MTLDEVTPEAEAAEVADELQAQEVVVEEVAQLTPSEIVDQLEPVTADNLRSAVEAILMITDAPISIVAIATALERPVTEIRDAINSLKADYDGAEGQTPRGFELREVGGGWRIYVRADFDWAVKMFVANENPTKLSQAALETLAVIAYKQPISRGQIASIRAVNVDSVVRTLHSRGLITELYTDSESGAIHYGTAPLLLEVLGINSLDELPLISPYLPDANSNFDAV
jgi:segregation and condensation protein B